jgi:hypothetical protein
MPAHSATRYGTTRKHDASTRAKSVQFASLLLGDAAATLHITFSSQTHARSRTDAATSKRLSTDCCQKVSSRERGIGKCTPALRRLWACSGGPSRGTERGINRRDHAWAHSVNTQYQSFSARCVASGSTTLTSPEATCGMIRLKFLKIGCLGSRQRQAHQGRHSGLREGSRIIPARERVHRTVGICA